MTATPEHPWEAARRLGRELSAALAECSGGTWCAQIMPAGNQMAVAFAAIDRSPEIETSNQRVNRLGAELADALDGYMDQRFHARIYPASVAGRSVFLLKR